MLSSSRRKAAPSIAATSDSGWDYDKVATRSDWDLASLHITSSSKEYGGKIVHRNPHPSTPETHAVSDNVDVASSHLSYIEDNRDLNYQDFVFDWKDKMEAVKTNSGGTTQTNTSHSSHSILLTPLELSILNPDLQAKAPSALSSSSSVVSSLGAPSLIGTSIYSDYDDADADVLKKDRKNSKMFSRSQNKRETDWAQAVHASSNIPAIPSQEELEAAYEQLRNTSTSQRHITTSGALVRSHSTIKQQRIQARQHRRRSTYLSKSSNAILADRHPILHSYDGQQLEEEAYIMSLDHEQLAKGDQMKSHHPSTMTSQRLLGQGNEKNLKDKWRVLMTTVPNNKSSNYNALLDDDVWIDDGSKSRRSSASSNNVFFCLFQCFLPASSKRQSLESTDVTSCDIDDSEDYNIKGNGNGNASCRVALRHEEDLLLRRGSF